MEPVVAIMIAHGTRGFSQTFV